MGLVLIAAAAVAAPASAQAPPASPDAVRRVAPALADDTDRVLLGDLWKRPGLSPRDRSIVTVATLIATGKADQLPPYVARALDDGVTPAEIGEIVTHLAYYAGWPDATAAAEATDRVFRERRIPASALQPVRAAPLPPPANDATRAARVRDETGAVSPTLADLTNRVLFDDLWRRPDLAPRDRSLVTIVALAADGDTAQLGSHLRRGLANGLTRAQLGEAMAQLAFYAGWPKAFSGTAAIAALDRPQ